MLFYKLYFKKIKFLLLEVLPFLLAVRKIGLGERTKEERHQKLLSPINFGKLVVEEENSEDWGLSVSTLTTSRTQFQAEEIS